MRPSFVKEKDSSHMSLATAESYTPFFLWGWLEKCLSKKSKLVYRYHSGHFATGTQIRILLTQKKVRVVGQFTIFAI